MAKAMAERHPVHEEIGSISMCEEIGSIGMSRRHDMTSGHLRCSKEVRAECIMLTGSGHHLCHGFCCGMSSLNGVSSWSCMKSC